MIGSTNGKPARSRSGWRTQTLTSSMATLRTANAEPSMRRSRQARSSSASPQRRVSDTRPALTDEPRMGRVSEIPRGSPPVPPGRHAAPSGWYADPIDAGQERYWDGWQWSRNTRAREGTAAPGQGPAGHPPQPGLSANPGYSQYPGYPQQGPSQPWTGQPTAGRPGQATLTADGVPLAGWWWRALSAI